MAALSAVAALFVLMFWPALFGGRFLLLADSFAYSLPLRTVIWRMLLDGSPPLWTPLVLSGYPLLSMAQAGAGYPLTWGYAFLPGHWAESVYLLAPYLLAPAFTYAYCRGVGRTRLASLLAGLSFAYGGMMFSKYTTNGMMTNALMWLPLVLLSIERARTHNFTRSVLGVALAYSMSVLTGIGQGFVYVGALSLLYAAFLSLANPAPDEGAIDSAPAGAAPQPTAAPSRRRRWQGWQRWRRWRPLAAACFGMLLAAGVAAFQILETLRAARRSVRHALSYETFVEGSFTPRLEFVSLLKPFYSHEVLDVTAYVASLTLCLAGVGAWYGLRRGRGPRRDTRVFFWLLVAALAWVLMLGENTPLYRLVYHVPVINRFRVPSRHSFEWSFALSALAAYGWDALASRARARRRGLAPALVAFAAALATFFFWGRALGGPPADPTFTYAGLAESYYLLFKLCFTLALAASLWWGFSIARPRARAALLASVVVLGCGAEPHFLKTFWWFPFAKPAERPRQPALASQILARHAPHENRVYTRVNLFPERQDRLDPQNLSMLHGLHNVAGYEPFMLARYSRALGGVGVDSVNPRPGLPRDETLLAPQSHVLDLLNTTFLVTFDDLSRTPPDLNRRDGITFDGADFEHAIKPGARIDLGAFEAEGDTLAFVSVTNNSAAVEQGTPVVRARLHASDGRVVERDLRAGLDTAEWAHERADVRPVVRHTLAPVFDSARAPGDDFVTHRYLARLPLGERLRASRVELINVTGHSSLILYKAALYDSTTGRTRSLRRDSEVFDIDRARWRTEHGGDGLLILRNTRALPRAWLVAEAESVDGEEALRRIRGEPGARSFNPRRAALVEASPGELPALPGGEVRPGASARIAYAHNRIDIETESPTPAMLVVSETFYPGWEATVDGAPAQLFITNFILRGVAVPAGRHRVEMRYTAPAARNGALISLTTILFLSGLAFYPRRAATPNF